jgi:hypothetical protein
MGSPFGHDAPQETSTLWSYPESNLTEPLLLMHVSESKTMITRHHRRDSPHWRRGMIDAQYRQGDVLLVRVASLPNRISPIEPDDGRVVLAYGEVTGHAHAMRADRVHYFREDGTGRGFIQIHGGGPVALAHDEHDAISVEPGVYEVRRQREYRPQRSPRMIAD